MVGGVCLGGGVRVNGWVGVSKGPRLVRWVGGAWLLVCVGSRVGGFIIAEGGDWRVGLAAAGWRRLVGRAGQMRREASCRLGIGRRTGARSL